MTKRHPQGRRIIVISFLVAFMLSALPMPEWASLWRPGWVALVLIYWCMALPQKIGVATGWLVGLMLDVLLGTVLGQHALAMCVIAFVTHKLHRQVRVLPVWQQGISVFLLVLFYQVLVLWINGIQGVPVEVVAYWASPLVSTVLWPWVFIILRDLRRRYHVT